MPVDGMSTCAGVLLVTVLFSSIILIGSCNSFNKQGGLTRTPILDEVPRELTTFDELYELGNSTEQLGVISLVVHAPRCESETDLGHLHVVVEFSNWLTFDDGEGNLWFRATKNFISDEGERVFWLIKAKNDNVTEIHSRHFSAKNLELLFERTFLCPIGEGARFFAYGLEKSVEKLNDYQDLKGALFSGREINAKAIVSECDGYFLTFARLINSKWVENWEITNEGSDEELIWITWDAWVDDHNGPTAVGVEKIIAKISPVDGSVQYQPLAFDLISWTEGFLLGEGFTCQLGSSFQIEAYGDPALPPIVYATYDELLRGLEEDKDIEIVVEASKCEWDSPPGQFDPTIFSQRPSLWTVHRAEDRTFVSMFENAVANSEEGTGRLIQQQYAVEQDGTVSLALHRLNMITEEVERIDLASCSLGSAVTIRSNLAPRQVLETYEDLRAVLMEGRRVSWYADLKACTGFLGDVTVEAGGTFTTGVAFDPMANNGTFTGFIVQLANPDEAGEKFGWVAMSINWIANVNELIINFAEYDHLTWEDNLQSQGVATCPIGFPDAYLFY